MFSLSPLSTFTFSHHINLNQLALKQSKERALKREEKQKMLLDNFKSSYAVARPRSCRNRRPISYTFGMMDFQLQPVSLLLFGQNFWCHLAFEV